MLNRDNEIYLGLAKAPTSGGGSGTISGAYSDLTGKPMINGVVIVGNKSSDSFGLQDKLTAGEGIEITADGVISSTATGGTDLTPEQLDAVNSGITAEKVAEYDLNLEEFEELNGEVATLEAELTTVKNDLGDLGDQVIENNNAIATKNDIFQLSEFPTLTTTNVPEVFQYTGPTIGSHIKGHIYKKTSTTFKQWYNADTSSVVVTMEGAGIGNSVYQADGKTVLGTITAISDSEMSYTDTDGQAINGLTYQSTFTDEGFEEVYEFEGGSIIASQNAEDIIYSNVASGLMATNVQEAIDKLQLNKVDSINVYSKDDADTTFIKATEKGQANGVATLNDSGVIPSDQINISSLNVKGTWDASTNTPTLANGVGESGDFYITSVAGAVDFGAGEINFSVGDWALYTDSGVWEKSVNASAVQSVNGKTGLVNVLDTDVLNEDQLKAVNSGIDDVKVAQIETNKTEIATNKTDIAQVKENLNITNQQVELNKEGIETINTELETLQTNIETKLDKTTDVANAGKSLVVDDEGNIVFEEDNTTVYTSLQELGLTADATLDDVITAMSKGSSALIGVTEFTNAQTMFPYEEGNDYTFGRVFIVKGNDNGRIYAKWFRKDGAKECIAKINVNTNSVTGWRPIFTNYYTSLGQLGLTAPTTVGEVFVAMPDKSMFMLNVENVADANVTITDAPHNYGLLTIEKHSNSRFRIEFSNSLGGNVTDVRKWIGSLKGSDGTGLTWKELTVSLAYTTLTQLGLTSSATIQDVIDALPIGGNAIIRTDSFTDRTQFNGIQYGYLSIDKTVNGLSKIELCDITSNDKLYYGRQASGKFNEWVKMTINEILHTSLSGNLAGITTVLDLVNAMVEEYRALSPKKPVRFVSGEIGKTTLTDLPQTYGLLQITVVGYDVVEISYAGSSFGFKTLHLGTVNRISGESLFSSITWKKVATKSIYNSVAELNNAKGTNIELVNGEDNTQKIVDVLNTGEQFVSFYHNNANQNRFGIDVSFGNLIHELRITKCLDADLTANYATVTAFMNTGCVLSRIFYKTYSTDWTSTKDYIESLSS